MPHSCPAAVASPLRWGGGGGGGSFCLLGQPLVLWEPAHVKGPVSHGFRVIVEGRGFLSTRASSDLLNPEMKIPEHLEPSLTGCREGKRGDPDI